MSETAYAPTPTDINRPHATTSANGFSQLHEMLASDMPPEQMRAILGQDKADVRAAAIDDQAEQGLANIHQAADAAHFDAAARMYLDTEQHREAARADADARTVAQDEWRQLRETFDMPSVAPVVSAAPAASVEAMQSSTAPTTIPEQVAHLHPAAEAPNLPRTERIVAAGGRLFRRLRERGSEHVQRWGRRLVAGGLAVAATLSVAGSLSAEHAAPTKPAAPVERLVDGPTPVQQDNHANQQAEYPPAAYQVSEGEGLLQTMRDMGITDPALQQRVLHNPELTNSLLRQGVTYDTEGHLNMPSNHTLSQSTLDSIKKAAATVRQAQ